MTPAWPSDAAARLPTGALQRLRPPRPLIDLHLDLVAEVIDVEMDPASFRG